MKVISVLIAGGALVLVQILIGRAAHLIPLSGTVRRKLARIRPGFFFLLWVLFGFWALQTLIADSPFYTVLAGGLVGVLVVLFAWFILRDLVAGVIFSTKHPDSLNRRIRAGGVTGRVLKAGLTGLQVAADGGEVLSVPYSNLVGEVAVENAQDQSLPRFRTTLSLAGISGDVDSVRKDIQKEILLSPWVNHRHLPSVRLLGGGDHRTAEVEFHCLNGHHAAMVDERLRSRYTVIRAGAPGFQDPVATSPP